MMNKYDIKRLALVLSVQTEIIGMTVENYTSSIKNETLAYPGSEFIMKADELRDLANKHNDQL